MHSNKRKTGGCSYLSTGLYWSLREFFLQLSNFKDCLVGVNTTLYKCIWVCARICSECVCLFECVCVCLCLCVCVCLGGSVCDTVSLCVCVCVSLTLCLCVSVCVSVCVWVCVCRRHLCKIDHTEILFIPKLITFNITSYLFIPIIAWYSFVPKGGRGQTQITIRGNF